MAVEAEDFGTRADGAAGGGIADTGVVTAEKANPDTVSMDSDIGGEGDPIGRDGRAPRFSCEWAV